MDHFYTSKIVGEWLTPSMYSGLCLTCIFGLFSRTAGLNALLYLVDLHVGCLQVILAGAAVLWALVQRV